MSPVPMITEQMLAELRTTLSGQIAERRFLHTLGVEKEIVRLGEIYLPNDLIRLRVAALLHDITKELDFEGQCALCKRYQISIDAYDRLSPKIMHAKTAAAVIADQHPLFADSMIIQAVAQHTTGAPDMSLFAKLLYLADYIEETRTFADCVTLRQAFWGDLEKIEPANRLLHLNRVLLRSFDMTIQSLIAENGVIAPATFETRNALIAEINNYNI